MLKSIQSIQLLSFHAGKNGSFIISKLYHLVSYKSIERTLAPVTTKKRTHSMLVPLLFCEGLLWHVANQEAKKIFSKAILTHWNEIAQTNPFNEYSPFIGTPLL